LNITFFEVTQVDDSGHRILQENTGIRWNMEQPEIIGKNAKIFRPGYCFHKITGITWNRQFPEQVVRPGYFFLNIHLNDK
jgi:hypothetical protein